MLPTATQQLQRQVSEENLCEILSGLSLADQNYVKDLSQDIVTNFASPAFSLEDWRQVNCIFRFFILAKTNKCRTMIPVESELNIAQQLCQQFSHDEETISMVFDMAASQYVQRAICQNQYSFDTIGPVLRNEFARGVDGSELYSIVLAVGAAFLNPGKSYCVYKQKHYCVNDELRAFDMKFYVHPTSLLFVVWGKLSKEEE